MLGSTGSSIVIGCEMSETGTQFSSASRRNTYINTLPSGGMGGDSGVYVSTKV